MNAPPPEIPAMSAPPPAPPPPKSNALKWILIGCGGALFLGLLVCAGCFTIGYFVVKAAINQGVEAVRPIIASNETVKSEIGEVRTIKPRWQIDTRRVNGRETVQFTLDVEGDKGKGIVNVLMTERRKDKHKNEAYFTLTFTNAATSKETPIGTWRVYDDGKGHSGFEPVKGEPPPEPDDN